MKKTGLLILLLTVSVTFFPAQAAAQAEGIFNENEFETNNVPQWARDLRRWEIVLFGSFPFAMFTSTLIMDSVIWIQAGEMGMNDQARRYAPWPLKSSGAIAMGDRAQVRTIGFAVGLSAAVAFADLIIVQVRRQRERKKAELLPVATTIITRSPWPDEPEDEIQEIQESEQEESEPAPLN